MDFLQTMRAVWENSLDGVVITDTSTNIVDANPSYCRMAGYSREELVGNKTNRIRSGLTPRSVFNDMWEALGTDGKWVGELVNRRKDGTIWISYLSITRVVDEAGDVQGYVGIARDLTERRRLQDMLREQSTRLSALLDAIHTGVALFDPGDRCVVVNENLSQMIGCSADALLDRTRAEFSEIWQSFFREADPLPPAEGRGQRMLTTKDAPPLYFSVRWGPVISDQGTHLGQILTLRDITRETEVDRMKSEFIATVSHELRTPMTSIKGALGLLRGGAAGQLTSQQADLLDMAYSNVDRLIRLVNDILDLSRIESGRLELQPTSFDLNKAVQQAVHELETVRRERSLSLDLYLSDTLPKVQADPDRIGQVLINLLGNAYKFTETGGRVEIATHLKDSFILVTVKDTGPGIPVDQLEAIFDRFQRSSGVASRRAGGTGLGLAIARSIVQEHGGRIWADSIPGQGATFTFTLPVT